MPGEIRSYQDLQVWEAGMELAETAYKITKSFPKEEIFGLTSQIRRAAGSIPANIAEGWGRETPSEFVHFLRISQGSLKELETHVLLAGRVALLEKTQVHAITERTTSLGKMIRALICSLMKKR